MQINIFSFLRKTKILQTIENSNGWQKKWNFCSYCNRQWQFVDLKMIRHLSIRTYQWHTTHCLSPISRIFCFHYSHSKQKVVHYFYRMHYSKMLYKLAGGKICGECCVSTGNYSERHRLEKANACAFYHSISPHTHTHKRAVAFPTLTARIIC